MIISIFGILLTIFGTCFSNPSCPEIKPNMVNVHLVCHTHDDVGWLKTVDEYYYGSRKDITSVGVQYILDSVIPFLVNDPSKKFIYVESAFFFRWWDEQDDTMKNTVKQVVENGQLEFINGGWCMNDEASAHYNSIIDQMTVGLVRLNDTFGPVAFPRIGWQIDPFGHSNEQASLFAQMGMDGEFFARIDWRDKSNRWDNKEMEVIWKSSHSLGEDSSWIFTGDLPHHYEAPSGFCFDINCGDDPIMDDPRLEDYNKDDKVRSFIDAVNDQLTGYISSQNIMMAMGSDFHYVNANTWYKNLDKLIKYVNELQSNGSNVNLVYSTPSCYVDALHNENITWPTKTNDFFPYATDQHTYWTGYFTSRPTLKGFEKQGNNVLQVC
ncbi:Lysosomal alpha-mannosidase, partial [Armadillidium nasatum]